MGTIHRIIRAIDSQEMPVKNKFGDLISNILFPVGKYALFVSFDRKYLEILVRPNAESEAENIFRLLAELLSVLRELEDNHMIYLLPEQTVESSCLFYEGRLSYDNTSLPSEIKIGKDLFLKINGDDTQAIEMDGKAVLCGTTPLYAIYPDIVRYFCSIIIPTNELTVYIKHGFRTREEQRFRTSTRLSRAGIFIAIVIAIVSAPISVYFGNRYGTSKINDSQFKQLLDSIGSIKRNSTAPAGNTVPAIKPAIKKETPLPTKHKSEQTGSHAVKEQ